VNNKTQNGFTFWGISKPPRRPSDPLAALEHSWERYHGNVAALVKEGVTDENRSNVVSTIRKHAQAIESLPGAKASMTSAAPEGRLMRRLLLG
jgi:hypothetical protein